MFHSTTCPKCSLEPTFLRFFAGLFLASEPQDSRARCTCLPAVWLDGSWHVHFRSQACSKCLIIAGMFLVLKNLPANAGDDLWVRKTPWRKAWQPTPGFLHGESHGQSSLEGYSPWSHRESDMTEVT